MKAREQFNRDIASFQAHKHRCADRHIRLFLSKALLDRARFALKDANTPGDEADLSAAKYFTCDNYSAIAADSISLQGGVAFTGNIPAICISSALLWIRRWGSTNDHRDTIFAVIRSEYGWAV